MKYKVAELSGALLDAAVAKADGLQVCPAATSVCHILKGGIHPTRFSPSSAWADGGPIIEREGIELLFNGDQPELGLARWWAGFDISAGEGERSYGPTALIAAMRAFVASKFRKYVLDKPILNDDHRAIPEQENGRSDLQSSALPRP